jgi:O-antigen/teichoic acid export membrane protein
MLTIKISERIWQLFNGILSSFATRLLGITVTILMTPILVSALSPDDYAVIAVIMAFSIVFSYADLGMGLGMVNQLAAGNSDKKILVSSVYGVVACISVMAVLIGVSWLFWNYDDNVDIFSSYLVFVTFCGIGIFVGLIHRVLFGVGKITISNIWMVVGRILSLIFIYLIAGGLQDNRLLFFVLSLVGMPVLVNFFVTICFFLRHQDICPSLRFFSIPVARSQLLQGFGFFLMQLSLFFDNGIDVVIASSYFDSVIVRDYDLIAKVYLYVPALLSIALFPLWPILRSALANGEAEWVRRMLILSLILTVSVAVVVVLFLNFYISELIHIWVDVDITIDSAVITGFSVFSVLSSIAFLQSIYLNSVGAIKLQAFFAVVFIVITFVAKWYSADSFGVYGIVWSGVVCYSLKIFMIQFFFKMGSRSEVRGE